MIANKQTKSQIMEGVESVKSHVIENNTVEYWDKDNNRIIRLHNTDIVKFYTNGVIELNSGGWRTPTTKNRINDYAPGVRLYQEKSQWYVCGVLFYDGIKIKNGKVISKIMQSNDKKINAMKLKIKQYCDLITKDNLPIPSSGDCWFCAGFDKEGKQKDHLLQHIKEKYLHGSIMVNSMREAGYSDDQIRVHYSINVVDTFKRTLRRYLQKRLIGNIAVK